MEKSKQDSDERNEASRQRGFDVSDANARNLVLFGTGLLVFILCSMGILWWIFSARAMKAKTVDRPGIGTSIEQDWAQLDAEVADHLEGYHWNDDGKTIRIPIERAMELIAKEAQK